MNESEGECRFSRRVVDPFNQVVECIRRDAIFKREIKSHPAPQRVLPC